MPRPRDPNRNRAFEIYRDSGGTLDLVEIASQLNLPPGTIRGWKSKDNWDNRLNGTLQKNTERSKRSRGGQPNNRNATGPPGNKHAVKTGEFEELLFDSLDPEERQLVDMVQPDKEQLLLQEIKLLTVRERRMLKRIDDLKLIQDTVPDMSDDQVPPGMSVVKYTAGIEKSECTDLKEYAGALGQIQAVEDALTRVQARKQKAIESLHRFGYDDARLELETMKFEVELLKQNGSEEENGDDGFMEAMNTVASEVWGDVDV